MVNQECAVLLSRAKITEAFVELEKILEKDKENGTDSRPLGLAIRVKQPTGGLDPQERKIIQRNKFEVIPAYFQNETIEGTPVPLDAEEVGVILLNGDPVPTSGVNPVWEFSDSSEFDYSFSFFSYDILKIILKGIEESAYSRLLLSCVKINLGRNEGGASTIHGESFVFKLEPYSDLPQDDKELFLVGGDPPVELGVPPFAIGFGCRHNWKKKDD